MLRVGIRMQILLVLHCVCDFVLKGGVIHKIRKNTIHANNAHPRRYMVNRYNGKYVLYKV